MSINNVLSFQDLFSNCLSFRSLELEKSYHKLGIRGSRDLSTNPVLRYDRTFRDRPKGLFIYP